MNQFFEQLHGWVSAINDPIWSGLAYMPLDAGLFFIITADFVQFRLFGCSIKEMLGSRKQDDDPHGITPFQAFVTGLVSRIGVGSIAGMATTIKLDRPGTVFWMWVIALIGMSSALVESSLTQLFKVRDYNNHHFRDGPAYYITQGLGQKWLGILFALSLIFCSGFVFETVQTNTIADTTKTAWGQDQHYIGVALVTLATPVIFSNVRHVFKATRIIVSLMTVLYLVITLFIIATNIFPIPGVFSQIFSNAFDFDSAAGGFLGGLISATMMQNIKRGLYSNETGMGSTPDAAAAAEAGHLVSQDMTQMLGVFVDTIIVCPYTAFIVLTHQQPYGDLNGVALAQVAIVSQVGGWGTGFLTAILFMFVFSTIIGDYAYAESNVQFIRSHWLVTTVFRMLALVWAYFSAIASIPLVRDMADMAISITAWISLVATLLLSPLALLLLKDYTAKLRMGKDPKFKLSKHPGLKRKIKSDI